jgi:glycosyltransferase 2 family protein
LIGTYLYFCASRKRLKIRRTTLLFPKFVTSISQIAVFSLDWAIAAAVLYCLIPNYPGQTYFDFFSIYLLAMATSIMSNVPGGIGIFETAIIFLLPKSISASDILGSLLAYRGIRFLLPLGIAIIFVCCFEIKRRLTKMR